MTCKRTTLTLPPKLTELVVGFKFRIHFQVCYLTMLPAVEIIQPWWYKNEYRAFVEWCRQGHTNILRIKLVPMPLCPSHISYELAWNRTWAFVATGLKLINCMTVILLCFQYQKTSIWIVSLLEWKFKCILVATNSLNY